MSLQEVMNQTTSTEFVDWMTFFEMERSSFHREDYYLAQIAAEVRRSIVKKPQEVQVQDFLLKFSPRLKKEEENWMKENPDTMEEGETEELSKVPESCLQKSKNYWFTLLGIEKK